MGLKVNRKFVEIDTRALFATDPDERASYFANCFAFQDLSMLLTIEVAIDNGSSHNRERHLSEIRLFRGLWLMIQIIARAHEFNELRQTRHAFFQKYEDKEAAEAMRKLLDRPFAANVRNSVAFHYGKQALEGARELSVMYSAAGNGINNECRQSYLIDGDHTFDVFFFNAIDFLLSFVRRTFGERLDEFSYKMRELIPAIHIVYHSYMSKTNVNFLTQNGLIKAIRPLESDWVQADYRLRIPLIIKADGPKPADDEDDETLRDQLLSRVRNHRWQP